MLRKRSRPLQQDQSKTQMKAEPSPTLNSSFSSDALLRRPKSSYSLFNVPGLFVGFSTKGLHDCDSARSPTSPLDYKLFSNLGGSSFVRSPRSPGIDGHPKSWDSSKVGLGLVDTLNDETNASGMAFGAADHRNIVFGSLKAINFPSPNTHLNGVKDSKPFDSPPKDSIFPCKTVSSSKPKSNSEVFTSDAKNSQLASSPPLSRGGMNFGNFSGSLPVNFGSSSSTTHGDVGSLSASEIELSEDYTCIISHGPHPKTTHIFGDCILENHSVQSPRYKSHKVGAVGGGSSWVVKCSGDSPARSPGDFLSHCFSCRKKLDGKDIYMYRGEKAFCSCDCREQEIVHEEEMELPATDSSDSFTSSFHDDVFLTGMMTT